MRWRDQLLSAVAFAFAGAATRYTVRHFETRWQIAIFCSIAAAYQGALSSMAGRRGSLGGFALDAASSTAAIVAAKALVEGGL